MALVPSSKNNNSTHCSTEEIHEDIRSIENFTVKQEQDNQSEVDSALATMINRTGHRERIDALSSKFHVNSISKSSANRSIIDKSSQQTCDETMYEQVYQIQEYRNGIPIALNSSSTRQKQSELMPILSIGALFQNRNRLPQNDDFDIQLPLIETLQTRPKSRSSISKTTTESLSALPLKRRRTPINHTLPLSSDSSKRDLINLPERGKITEITYNLNQTAQLKTNDSSIRLKSHSKEPLDTSVTDQNEMLNTSLSSPLLKRYTPIVESPTLSNSRLKKHNINRQLPISSTTCSTNEKRTFRLIIHDGHTKDETDDFLQYRQLYAFMWNTIAKIFRILEKIMCKYSVSIALIDGDKVADLAQMIDIERKPTLHELLNVIINRDEVEKLIRQPGRRFLGPNGKIRAATIIQSYWRGFRVRRIYKYLIQQNRAARIIALFWLKYSKLSKIRHQLKLSRHRQLEIFQLKQNELRTQWTNLTSNRRVIVHIPSLGITKLIRKHLNDLPIRENYQIGRICELADPNVDIVFVSPMPINDEILQYYNKLVNLRVLVEQGSDQSIPSISNNVSDRFTFVVPEALNRFPGHKMCLATLLKYSPKALKQIKNVIKDRPAYMVTSVTHVDDLYIAEYLNLPIFGCEPEVSYLYSTKSGSKRIFNSSNVPMPFGEFDIYNYTHLFESLAQLIIEHLDVQRWLFKIDDHIDGLGIAYCDISTYLPCYKTIVKEAEKYANQLTHKSVQKEFYKQILLELPDTLNRYAVFVNKTQFKSWQSYLKVFLSRGGIVEAYPPSDLITSLTVCISIELNGQYKILCSGDQLHAESQFSCWGLLFPQSTIDSKQLNSYCSSIAEQCKQRNIYGYIDIDFVLFLDKKFGTQKIWVTDLSIGYSEHLSLFRVLQYVTTGQFNSQNHKFTVKTKQIKNRLRNWQNGAPEYIITDKTCYAAWSSRLYHSNLANLHYSMFFQMCRLRGIGFDIREKQGSIFTLLEGEHHKHIGMITINETLQNTLSNFVGYISSMHNELTTNEISGESNFMLAVQAIESTLGITQDNILNVSLNTTTS